MSEGRRLRIASGVLVPIALVGWLGACGGRDDASTREAAPALSRPHVFVVVIDTARQDRFEIYGHNRPTTPNLARLAKRSRLYLNAYSTSGWTSSAHASLFTGLYPVAHRTTQEDWTLRSELVSLAELLSERGYETIGLVENPMLSRHYGFDQGFSSYHELWRAPHVQRGALPFFEAALEGRSDGTPLFVFVNLMAPHSPYNSARQFTGTFTTDPSLPLDRNLWREFFSGRVRFSERELAHLAERYDEEILYSDFTVGEMVKRVESHGLWESSFFLVTSDHGENIGDHGMMNHVFSLYESTVKVPLLVSYPPRYPPGSTDRSTVQLTDVFPTVLEVAGVPPDQIESQGVALPAAASGAERPAFLEYYFPKQALGAMRKQDAASPQLERFKRRLRAVVHGGYKFVWASDGAHELYDLGADPEERHDLAGDAAHRPRLELLRGLTLSLVARYGREASPTSEEVELDEETRETLRSLGYLE
jgi:arylsulfatase A-like enzyme